MSEPDGFGPAIPKVLRDGRYSLGALLGQGGMAIVCRAHDHELGVDRAIKLLAPRGDTRDTLRRRLRAEARAMARLHHPNILSVHDVGSEGDLDYVVMDLAEGGSLQDLVQRSPLAPALAVHLMIQVLSALSAAHAAGVVHRDVKPHNVLLDKGGRALLADFGIALLAGDDRRTRSGVAMGSLAFMPPEQRLDASRVGPTADVYAAGSTLYNLLSGANPVDLFMAGETSPRWQGIPPELVGILRRACSMHPEERYRDAATMEAALVAALPHLETLPVPAGHLTLEGPADLTHAPTRDSDEAPPAPTTLATRPTETPVLVAVPPSSTPWILGGVAIVALLMVALLGSWWTGSQPDGLTLTEPTSEAPVPSPLPPVPDAPSTHPAPDPAPVDPAPSEPTPALPVPGASSAPEPTQSPSPRPRAPGSRVNGRWTGSLGGVLVDVALRGSDTTLQGTFTSTLGSKSTSVPITGTLSGDQLVLADVGAPLETSARYELTLSEDGGTLEGRVQKDIGGVKTLILRRSK